MAGYESSNYAKHTTSNPLQQGLIDRFHGVVAAMLARARADTLLDVGCGEGFSSEVLRQGAGRGAFYALDVSVPALRIARTRVPDATWVGGSALNLPFADRSFDTVVCLEVLEHLHDPDRALLELARIARTSLVLSVPNEPLFRGANFLRGKNLRRWGNDAGHLQHWSSRGFRRFVARRLEVVESRAPFPWTVLRCRAPDDGPRR
jgi:2-polyprenyl-3-methyl-5-hydroxy-6-metoxy-1,4-benzoquinol methylase